MVENAAQIVDGILLAMKASGVSCAKVGIEDNKPDALRAMRRPFRTSRTSRLFLCLRVIRRALKDPDLFSDRPHCAQR